MSFTSEFKEFISRGNVIDLAVGVVIGAAFGSIVNSLVEDIIMPPLGLLIGGVNFSDLKIILQEASVSENGTIKEVAISYGKFIQVLISFILIALSVFIFIVKPMNVLKRKPLPTAPPAPSREESVLIEIRELLRK
jgi:large conductance mechanosensitive channel